MKKRIKLFLAAAIAAIVSVAAGLYSYNATQEKLLAQEQELLLNENVEALTDGESWFTRVMNVVTFGYYSSPIYRCVLGSMTVEETTSVGAPSLTVGYGGAYASVDFSNSNNIKRTVRMKVYFWDCQPGSVESHCSTCYSRTAPAPEAI